MAGDVLEVERIKARVRRGALSRERAAAELAALGLSPDTVEGVLGTARPARRPPGGPEPPEPEEGGEEEEGVFGGGEELTPEEQQQLLGQLFGGGGGNGGGGGPSGPSVQEQISDEELRLLEEFAEEFGVGGENLKGEIAKEAVEQAGDEEAQRVAQLLLSQFEQIQGQLVGSQFGEPRTDAQGRTIIPVRPVGETASLGDFQLGSMPPGQPHPTSPRTLSSASVEQQLRSITEYNQLSPESQRLIESYFTFDDLVRPLIEAAGERISEAAFGRFATPRMKEGRTRERSAEARTQAAVERLYGAPTDGLRSRVDEIISGFLGSVG